MRLLQAEDLRHHVVCGGVQQDPTRGQSHHHVAAHGRQTDRDGIGTCRGKDVKICRGSASQRLEQGNVAGIRTKSLGVKHLS